MTRFFIGSTSACLERMLDAQKVYSYLSVNGWEAVEKVAEADWIFISTCAFGEYADRCCVELIRHYMSMKKEGARIILLGCLPVIHPEKLSGLCEFSAVPPTHLDQLDGILGVKTRWRNVDEANRIASGEVVYKPTLKKLLNLQAALSGDLRREKSPKDAPMAPWRTAASFAQQALYLKAYINPFLVGEREKIFYLRISRGCLGNCSYCAKKFATGGLKSKAQADILKEFRQGLAQKEKLFFFLTEDAGCYGLDIGTTAVKLFEEIFHVGKGHDYKLVISNFNAQWFIKYYDDLERLIVNNQERIHYFHIPIQSGSNRVLGLMKRTYRIEDVEARLHRLREKVPALKLSTDIMVGFPGETDEDHQLTARFLENVGFDFADIFAYENRPGTPASIMTGRLSRSEMEQRRFGLLKIQSARASTGTVVKKVVEVSRDFIRREV